MDRADRGLRCSRSPRGCRAKRRTAGGTSLRRFLSLRLALSRLVEQELADQVLEHDRRLREAQTVAVLQHHAVAARFEPDVLLAEDPGGEDLRRRIARELVLVAEIDGDDGLVGLVVEADVGYPTDHHAGALHP